MDMGTYNSFATNYASVLGSLYENDERMLKALNMEVANVADISWGVQPIGDYLEATQDMIDSLNSLDLSSINAGINSSYDGLLSFNDGLEATQKILETIAETISTSLQIFPDDDSSSTSGGSGNNGSDSDTDDADNIKEKIGKVVDDTTKELAKQAVERIDPVQATLDALKERYGQSFDYRVFDNDINNNQQLHHRNRKNNDITLTAKIDVDDSELEEYSKGGNVNLELRPIIDTSELNRQGYDAGIGFATVFSHTFSNESGNVAVNFTPIIADPQTGKYLGVMNSNDFTRYCEEVIAGVHDDYLNLQIGATFVGDDAIQQAENAAIAIHEAHEKYLYSFENLQEEYQYLIATYASQTADMTREEIEELDSMIDDMLEHIAEAQAELNGLEIKSQTQLNAIKGTIQAVQGRQHADGTVGNAFADGTHYNGLSSSEKGALRSEYGQPELTVYPNGSYELTTTPTISDLPRGTVIFNENQTRRILKGNSNKGKAFANGTNERFVPLQLADPEKYSMLTAFKDYTSKIIPTVQTIGTVVGDLANKFTQVISPNNSMQRNVSLAFNGDINVTGVQDVNGLSKAIINQLPNMLLQEINKR